MYNLLYPTQRDIFMTSIELMYDKIKELQKQRTALFDQISPLQEKVASLHNEIKILQESITTETMKLEQTEQERFDFLMAENGGSSDMVRYHEAEKFIRSMGLYMSGYCPFSQQRTADFFVFKNDRERNIQTIESLKKAITLYKPMDENGNKWFRVFCQDYIVWVAADGSLSFKTSRSEQAFDTLEALFDYYILRYPCYDYEDDDQDD